MRTIKGPMKERGTKRHHTGGWGWVGGVGGAMVKKIDPRNTCKID